LNEASRMDLLRNHPAIVARLFDTKQECIWKYLLMGQNEPLGKVTDYWRRVEVRPNMMMYLLTLLGYVIDKNFA
jgi:hypothetical protein